MPMPVIADADHGYGSAPNAMRTVQGLERAGVAALSIVGTLLEVLTAWRGEVD